ncbi:monocarboxylate transporter 12-like [Glandiceps talaboti]
MTKKKPRNDGGGPIDGGYGWVVAIAGMVAHIIIGGVYYASSIFLVEFVEYFQQGAAQASWIGALYGSVFMFTGPPASALTRKFGTRPILAMGCVLSTTGIVLSTFAPSLVVLYFTYGLLVGTGFGLSSISSLLLLTKYFRKRYAIANGLVFSGYASGLLIFPLLFRYLIDTYGWRGSMLVIGSINANTLVCGALMRPLKTTKYRKSIKLSKKTLSDEQNEIEVHEQEVEKNLMLPIQNELTLSNRKEKTLRNEDFNGNVNCQYVKSTRALRHSCSIQISECHRCKETWSRRLRTACTHFGLNLFIENRTFSLICFAQFLEGLGYSVTNAHLVARVVFSGVSKMDASLLLTITGGAGLTARLGHGFLVDLKIISPTRLLGIAIAMYGIVMLIFLATNQYAVLAILAAFLGISSGMYQALIPVSMRECVGEKDMGAAFGWDYFLMGVGYFVGPPVAGWLYDSAGHYDVAFSLAGTLMITSGTIVVIASCVQSCSTNKETELNVKCSTQTDDSKAIIVHDYSVSSV